MVVRRVEEGMRLVEGWTRAGREAGGLWEGIVGLLIVRRGGRLREGFTELPRDRQPGGGLGSRGGRSLTRGQEEAKWQNWHRHQQRRGSGVSTRRRRQWERLRTSQRDGEASASP